MDNSKLREKLEKASRLADDKGKYNLQPIERQLSNITNSSISHSGKVEATKGHLLKALGQYRVSSEERKAVRQEKHFERMSSKINSLNNELNILENKYVEKNSLFEVRKEEIDRMKSEINRLTDHLEDTKQKIKYKDKAIIESTICSDKLKSELDILKAKVENYNSEYVRVEKGFEWQSSILRELDDERKELEESFNIKEKELGSLKRSQEEEIKRVDSVKVDIQNIKKMSIDLEENIYSTRTRIKEKELKYHEIVKDLNDHKRNVSQLGEEYKKVQDKLSRIKNHNDEIESKVLKFEAAKKELDKIIFDKKNLIGSIEASIVRNKKSLQKLIDSSNREKYLIAEKDGHICSMKEEVELLKSKNNAQECELKVLREESFEINREYERNLKIRDEIKEQKIAGEDEVNRIRKNISEKNGAISSMNSEIKENKLAINQFNLKMRTIVEELEELKVKEGRLKYQHENTKNEKQEISQRHKEIVSRVEKLNNNIKKYNAEIESNQEAIHIKEEEELFLGKKIEALESLLLEKKKREEMTIIKKNEQENINRLMSKRLADANQKYHMVKQKEEKERKSLKADLLTVDKIKDDILKINNEIENTIITINDLRKRRDDINNRSLKLENQRSRSSHRLQNVLNGETESMFSQYDDENTLVDDDGRFSGRSNIEV